MDGRDLPAPELVRRVCGLLGISQRELARRLGTYPATVNRWVRGHKPPHRLYRQELERLYREAVVHRQGDKE